MSDTLEKLNYQITNAIRQLKEYDLPFSLKELTVLIGLKEAEDLQNATYIGAPDDYTGFEPATRFGMQVVFTQDDSRLEICWTLPYRAKR